MLISGNMEGIPDHELTAVVFAQHYADTRGNPSKEAWERIVTAYGKEKALGILGAVRMIMIGNIYGIALSAFRSRLKGKKIAKSNLMYEIRMITSIIILIPVALIHVFVSKCLHVPVIEFK